MRIERQKFLDSLNLVKPGLSPREFIEQSNCFAFKDGEVFTFNDEVSCRKEIELDVTGAVQAQSLLDILDKMTDEFLEVVENENGELEFSGKRKRFGVTKEKEIFLPIERVERAKEWSDLPKEFTEAIGLVQHCVSTDESQFLLTCVHLTKDFVESCDNLQIMRVELDNKQFAKPALIRGASLSHLTTLAMNKVARTQNWVHFQNEEGLTYSCRQFIEDYPPLDDLLKVKGHPITLPKGLVSASERAAVFASDRVGEPLITVTLRTGGMRIKGKGNAGWYQEIKEVSYEGPDLEFLIAPDLLKHVSDKYSDATISQKRMKASGGQWQYVTVLASARG